MIDNHDLPDVSADVALIYFAETDNQFQYHLAAIIHTELKKLRAEVAELRAKLQELK